MEVVCVHSLKYRVKQITYSPSHSDHHWHYGCFLQLPQFSYFFPMKLALLCIFSISLSFTRASPGMVMSMILASIAGLSTKAISGLYRASTILSHCTLKSHRALKPLFSTAHSGVCLYHFLVYSSSVFPHSAHTEPHCHSTSCIHVVPTCCTHFLGGLHFLLSLHTSYT